MATYTDNYHLEKPAQSDLYNIDVFNGNADIIDAALASKALAQNQATIESTNSASRNYAKGEFLVYNGLLYKVTAAISSGGTIAPGTNCVATNTGTELKALNDSLVGSTYWITSGYFTTASRVEKSGNVKILFLETIGSNTAMNTSNSYVDYFTLPEGYRPKASVLQRFFGYAGNTPNYWLLRITTDGVVSLANYSGVQHPGFEVMVAYI